MELISPMFLTFAANFYYLLSSARNIILAIIDFFHRPFARVIPTQTFRYLACGGSNTVLNIFIEYIGYNFIMHKQSIPVYGDIVLTPEVGAWIIANAISVPAGFIMSRHIVFPESNLHGRVQLFRYALIFVTLNILTYVMIKAFTFCLPMINQTVRYTFICIVSAILSYISQLKFTFKTVPTEVTEEVIAEVG